MCVLCAPNAISCIYMGYMYDILFLSHNKSEFFVVCLEKRLWIDRAMMIFQREQ